MINFNIGSLALISGGQAAPGFILQTPIEGLESPEYRNNVYENSGRNGATVSSQFYGARIISLRGIVRGENPTEFETRRRQLAVATAIRKDLNGYPLPTRIAITTLTGTAYFVDVYFDKPIYAYKEVNFSEFMLTATSTNPFLFGANQINSSAISAPIGGGYVVPMIVPYISAASSGGNITVSNPGTVEALPIITMMGPLNNPVITNMTTGKFMRLNYFIAAGNTASIDMFNQTITVNNSSSLIGTKSDESDWWSLDIGNNIISLSTSNSADTGTASLSFYAPYVGI